MSKNKSYQHKAIEKKWQSKWFSEGLFKPNLKQSKKPFYNLWMFPYPSAEGLHAGHAFASTGSDVFGRFSKMQGKQVLQPIGYDSFGIHSENFAIKTGKHPKRLLDKTTKTYEKQLKSLGHGYDWTRTVTTSHANYYKWTQWLFLQMFKSGLAYRKKSIVNWCPSCKTVLADEQVMTPKQAGKKPKRANGSKVKNLEQVLVCERCATVVESKELKQWFFRITDYAEALLEALEQIDWPEKIKNAQQNWIGKSEGAVINFQLSGSIQIKVFTTRPDTLYGTTFLAVSPDSEYTKNLLKFVPKEFSQNVSEYIERHSYQKVLVSKADQAKEKSGIFTGIYAKNPANKKKIPIWIADYVMAGYGSGAIMGVPAHDQRDWEFAKENGLAIVEVIRGGNVKKEAYDGQGKIVNSEDWNGIEVPKKLEKVYKDIFRKKWGKAETNYHLRDWIISRQRYWGPPIPMIFCKKCAAEDKSWLNSEKAQEWLNNSNFNSEFKKKIIGNWELGIGNSADWSAAGWWPVEEKDLPVELPQIEEYLPKGEGKGPLADHPEFYEVKCPECGSAAKRETDVSDTFLDSSWYFLRYPSVSLNSKHKARNSKQSQNSKKKNSKLFGFRNSNLELPWDPKVTRRWLPVDLYFGGAEHAVLHLMYSRFVTKVLHDFKHIDFQEPFPRFFAHGLMIKDGAKMSKSRGNVVNPDIYIEKFGADTLRLYLMFMGPMDGYPDFRDTGIEGMRRFIERVWRLFQIPKESLQMTKEEAKNLTIKMHQNIKKVTVDIENFRYNTAIAAIMEFVNFLRDLALTAESASPGSSSTFGSQNSPKSASATRTRQSAKSNIGSQEWEEAVRTLTKLITPFAPHMAEEVWCEVLGQKFSVHSSKWPRFNPSLTRELKLTIPVQVDGKLRATLEVKSRKGGTAARAKVKSELVKLAKRNKNVAKWLKNKDLKDTVFVPGKLINFVTKN